MFDSTQFVYNLRYLEFLNGRSYIGLILKGCTMTSYHIIFKMDLILFFILLWIRVMVTATLFSSFSFFISFFFLFSLSVIKCKILYGINPFLIYTKFLCAFDHLSPHLSVVWQTVAHLDIPNVLMSRTFWSWCKSVSKELFIIVAI